MIEIREIKSKDTIPIRSEILRPGQNLDTCIYPHDDDCTSFHLAAFSSGEQTSIASFYLEIHPDLEGSIQYRFRGMATKVAYRNQGLAGALLTYAFEKIKALDCNVVWCNARVNAIQLYMKMGMEICSDEFDIPGIGPHFLMKKEF